MSFLAKIRNIPLLRSVCVKKPKTKNAFVREPNEVLVDIFACLDYPSIYALAWAGQPLAYFICAADQHRFLPRPREMTLTLRGGIFFRPEVLLTSNGSTLASVKIREAWKAQLSRNVARTVTTATQKVLKTRGQHPVTHLKLLHVSKRDLEELLRTWPTLRTVDRLNCKFAQNFIDLDLGLFTSLTDVRLVLGYEQRMDYDQRVDCFEKFFQATWLRALHHLEVCDEPLPYRLHDVVLDYLFDFSLVRKPEKFVRIDGTTFSDAFQWKLTKRLSDASETIVFVSATLRCYSILDDSDMLRVVFVKERSHTSSFVAPNGRSITTIRRGESFIVTNNLDWLQRKLPALSFAF